MDRWIEGNKINRNSHLTHRRTQYYRNTQHETQAWAHGFYSFFPFILHLVTQRVICDEQFFFSVLLYISSLPFLPEKSLFSHRQLVADSFSVHPLSSEDVKYHFFPFIFRCVFGYTYNTFWIIFVARAHFLSFSHTHLNSYNNCNQLLHIYYI